MKESVQIINDYIISHKDEVMLYIKRAIQTNDSKLSTLLEIINSDQIENYSSHLDHLEKKKLAQMIKPVAISKQACGELLLELKKVQIEDMNELPQDLLLEINNLSDEQIHSFISKHPKLAQSLLTLLPHSKLTHFFNSIKESELQKILQQPFAKNESANFVERLRQHVKKKSEAPIKSNLLETLMKVTPDKEIIILEGLKNELQEDELRAVLRLNIPSFIIQNLEEQSFQKVLDKVSNQVLVNYILALSIEEQSQFIETYLQDGSNRSEMLKMELDDSKAQGSSKTQNKAFFEEARSIILSNETLIDQCYEQIDEWLKD